MDDDAPYELAGRQYGLITSHQLRSLGYPRNAFADRARSAGWEALSDEVLRRSGAPAGRGQTALAAVLDAGPGAVLSHTAAAAWWGVPGCQLEPLHVTRVTHSRRHPCLPCVLHTVRSLPSEWVTRLDSVPVVRPELVAMQLFAQLRFERAERYADHLWSMRLLSGRAIDQLLTTHARRGRNGIGGLRRYRDDRPGAHVPPATALEGRAIGVLADAGIPMRRQVDSGGEAWVGRVDLRHEHEPLIAEIQSERFHSALSHRRDDEERRRRLELAGFVVVELWDDQVWRRPREVVETVRGGLAELVRRSPALP